MRFAVWQSNYRNLLSFACILNLGNSWQGGATELWRTELNIYTKLLWKVKRIKYYIGYQTINTTATWIRRRAPEWGPISAMHCRFSWVENLPIPSSNAGRRYLNTVLRLPHPRDTTEQYCWSCHGLSRDHTPSFKQVNYRHFKAQNYAVCFGCVFTHWLLRRIQNLYLISGSDVTTHNRIVVL